MKKVDNEKPTTHMFPSEPDATTDNKKSYLSNRLSCCWHVCSWSEKKQGCGTIHTVNEDTGTSSTTRCICPKSFAHHGQLKKDHEAQHNPPVPVTSTDTHILRSTGVHPWKMMTCCLTREHSFMYMYLKHQGGSSNKFLRSIVFVVSNLCIA